MNKRKVGTVYEELAINYLRKEGYCIVDKNYRCRFGEIDLIAKEGCYLVFIEVKYRKTKQCGAASFAVTTKKQKTISKVAGYYLYHKHLLENVSCRFDVVAIDNDDITLIKNAFEYIE